MENFESMAGSSADGVLSPEATAQGARRSAAESDPWVFREGQREIAGPALLSELSHRIASFHTVAGLTDALIQAGELESALADAGCSKSNAAAELTDALAFALSTGTSDQRALGRLAAAVTTPERIRTSPPEGFTYYGLHPLAFTRLVSRIREEPRACAVIGIRTIGTTLSAMVAAALKVQSRPVSRVTVRPTGHPYSRTIAFSPEESAWIREQLSRAVQFLVVDEGPGRSGSTFLAVAEALIGSGVPRELITILGSREVDPRSLLAEQAASRWNRFRFIATTASVDQRFENCQYIGGGEWRKWLLPETPAWPRQEWPESWTQMERVKFLSEDGHTLFKFEGMGPLGATARERSFALAVAGFSPPATEAGDGFLAYSVLKGATFRPSNLNPSLLERMARYCAFRAANFTARTDRPDELGQMLEYNVRQEFGVDLILSQGALRTQNPVLVDGQMQPHEWISAERIFKTDSVDHGDNHFFPGPCDIAWDLAGAVIEWQMTPDTIQIFLSLFRKFSGIDASVRLPIYLLAYSVFRLGFCKMAISMALDDEVERLRRAFLRYRQLAIELIHSHPHSRNPSAAESPGT
jgi:hypothetical protein